MSNSLQGKVVLITGGSRGLGAAMAETFADHGADVAISYAASAEKANEFVPFGGVADYAGTKAALAGYARGIARDLGPRNITVNVVQPGVMSTDMNKDVADQLPPLEALLDLHAIHRFATLEEVSEAVCFLAGPHGGYITGETLNVAGA